MTLENSVELWHDKSPRLESINIKLSDKQDLIRPLGTVLQKQPYYLFFQGASNLSEISGLKYTALFLRNSLKQKPVNLHYSYKHEIVELIKSENSYKTLISLIKRRIETGEEKGEIFPGSTEETSIAFNDSADLHFALHGVKK